MNYLYLGKQVVVPYESIVGIFDLENTSQSYLTREFLAEAEKNGQVITVAEDIPRTFVICCDEHYEYTIYLSQMSSALLYKRWEEKTEI